MTCKEKLVELGACAEAREFADSLSPAVAWATCPRGDWLLWAAGRLGVDRRLIVRAACDCARTAMKCISDPRPRLAIEAAERWCDGEATVEQVRAAAYAAYAAACAAACAADYNDYAAYAAAYAACAAAYAAYAAARAAYAAAYAAAARAAARAAGAHKQCADLVRARVPWEVVCNAL